MRKCKRVLEEKDAMQEFINFVADVMGVDPSELNAETSYGQIEKWDSMMHLRLVMEIEEKYDVEIPIDEVSEIRYLKDFYKYVK